MLRPARNLHRSAGALRNTNYHNMLKQYALRYVRVVDTVSHRLGRFSMFIVLFLIGILLYDAISRSVFDSPNLWSIELAQFAMAAYYLLGGGYALKHNAHARMDLFYHKWTLQRKAFVDTCAFAITFIYLSILLYGAIDSTIYAIEYDQRSYSPWKPSLIPVKSIMTIGILVMFLQSIAELIKDILIYKGHDPADLGRQEPGDDERPQSSSDDAATANLAKEAGR